MTTTPVEWAATSTTTSSTGSRFTGVGTLVRFLLRRDRVKLPAWTGGLGLFVLYLAAALPNVAGTEEDLRGASQLFNDPVGRLMIGPGYGFDEPTIERFVANGYGLYFALLAALMSILLVVRHTRLEEQTGRSELIRADRVGRSAPLTATVIVAVITNLVGGLLVFAMLVGYAGFGTRGSLVFATAIVATGLAFAGVTTITVQLSQYSRAAAGMAGGVLGLAYLLRAGGDMGAQGGTALSWTSPLAWPQQTAPFVLDRWWPLALSLAFALVTTAVGYALAERRDLGASWVATRPGPARGGEVLGTPLGLALRLQRASVLGWAAALAIGGLAFGAYADALLSAFGDLPEVFAELFGGGDQLLAGYLAYMAQFMAYLTAAYAVTVVQGLRGEETGGRLEPVLATPVSRWTWLASNLAVTAGAIVVLMAIAGFSTGVGALLVTGDAVHLWELTLAHLNQVPAVWVVLGVGVLLLGVAPRAVPAAWALVAFGLLAGTFGMLLDLPEAVLELSPFAHPAPLPFEGLRIAPVLALTLLAVVTAGAGLLAFRRRDLHLT
jgi:ABC-2 type transport system permease protein